MFEVPEPENLSEKVWRYLDLPKLIDVVRTRKLYLCRADKLEDRHEGGSLEQQLREEEDSFRNQNQPETASVLSELREQQREFTFINCWHLNDDDSHAMWRIYCGKEGVALQTTYLSLRSALDLTKFYIGKVSYGSKERRAWDLVAPFFHKRQAFTYEQEVRIIANLFTVAARDDSGKLVTPMPNGMRIDIDLKAIIENIWVHPDASEFYFQTVTSVVAAFAPDLADRVRWSKMRTPPRF